MPTTMRAKNKSSVMACPAQCFARGLVSFRFLPSGLAISNLSALNDEPADPADEISYKSCESDSAVYSCNVGILYYFRNPLCGARDDVGNLVNTRISARGMPKE